MWTDIDGFSKSSEAKLFTTVDQNWVGPLGRATVQVSPDIASNLNGPVHFFSRILQTNTLDPISKRWIWGPFRSRRAPLI